MIIHHDTLYRVVSGVSLGNAKARQVSTQFHTLSNFEIMWHFEEKSLWAAALRPRCDPKGGNLLNNDC
jgi:hypothetical protein